MRITSVYPVWYLTLLAAAYRDAGDLHKSIAAALEGIRLQPNDNDCSAYMLNSEQIHARPRQAIRKASLSTSEIIPSKTDR